MMVYCNGLLLGFSLIMALGPQNVFLIRQGALRRHATLSVFICFICDSLLIIGSVTGLHQLLLKHPQLQSSLTTLGVAFLFYYGVSALKRAFNPSSQILDNEQAHTRRQVILLALGFSLLNPHAIIDSLLIIGSNSMQFPDHQQAFVLGVATASLMWFSFLTLATYYFADILKRQHIWRSVEMGSGTIMLVLSLKLGWGLLV